MDRPLSPPVLGSVTSYSLSCQPRGGGHKLCAPGRSGTAEGGAGRPPRTRQSSQQGEAGQRATSPWPSRRPQPQVGMHRPEPRARMGRQRTLVGLGARATSVPAPACAVRRLCPWPGPVCSLSLGLCVENQDRDGPPLPGAGSQCHTCDAQLSPGLDSSLQAGRVNEACGVSPAPTHRRLDTRLTQAVIGG